MTSSQLPLALIQALSRRQQPRVGSGASVDVTLPDSVRPQVHSEEDIASIPQTERYAPRTQPGVASNMAYREGVDSDRVMPADAADPMLRLATRPRQAENAPVDVGIEPRMVRDDSIEAHDLPFRPDDRRLRIDEGLRSPDAARVRSAMDDRRELAANEPRGFWGKVGRVFGGIGKGAAGAAALGQSDTGLEALIGAIAGGVNPRYGDRLNDEVELRRRMPENIRSEEVRYRNSQAERQAAAEARQQANYDRQLRATEAQIANQTRDDDYRRTRDAQTDAYKRTQDVTSLEGKLRDDQRSAIDKGATRLTMPDLFTPRLDPKTKQPLGNAGEITQIGDRGVYRYPNAEQEQARKLAVAEAMGKARVENQVEAQAKLAPGRLLEGDVQAQRAEERDARRDAERDRRQAEKDAQTAQTAERKAAKAAHSEAWALRQKARKFDEEIKAFKADPNSDKSKLPQAEAESKANWEAFQTATEKGQREYPEYIKGSEGEGGYYNIEDFQEPKAKAAPQTSSQSSKSGGQKTILSRDQVQKYAEANGWSFEQARTYLLNTKKYDLQ